jgi:uncharacterized protein
VKMQQLIAAAVTALLAAQAPAAVRITEYMYNSTSASTGEFVEFTNLGSSAVDLAGWSFDDSSRTAGSTSLSAFGIVAPGQSVVLTDADASAFITSWSIPGVQVIGGNADNLGRADEINLYDAANNLVDRLTFGDQTYAGTPRTNGTSAWAYISGDGPFGIITSSWVLSTVGDAQGSVQIANSDTANPGRHVVPEPSACLSLSLALIGLARRTSRSSICVVRS